MQCSLSEKVSTCVQEEVESPEVHFEPVVKLAPVELKTNEEEEKELFRM